MNRRASRRSPTAFFLLLFALAVPIWLSSRFVGVIGALKIPVTDLLLAFTPMAAACILICREEGPGGVVDLLKRAVDLRGLARSCWALPTVLLAPAVYLVTFAALHLAGHPGEPEPHLLRLPVLAAIMFVLAIGEEAGWTGYVLDPLQARWGALGASLIIAVPWWAGHLPSILQIGGAWTDIAWWIPGAVALRILMVWLYNSSGGLLATAIGFHTVLNIGRSASYPTIGTHYDPAYQAVGYAIFAGVAVVVAALCGAKTLSARRASPDRC